MAADALALLRHLAELRRLDPSYSKGEVLGSMITEPPQPVIEAFKVFADTNLNDPLLFSQAAALEREVVEYFSAYFRSPSSSGFITSGGSESNLTALYVLRELRKGKVVLVPSSAHVSVLKACKVLGLRPVIIELDGGYKPRLDAIEDALKRLREEVVALVMTVGTTDLGIVEPVDAASKICEDYGVPIHVDAAFGGVVAQALGVRTVFDFRLRTVATLSVDLHKLLTPAPGGLLLFRERSLEDLVTFEAPYLPGGRQRGLLGTRTGGSAAAMWLSIRLYGADGFKGLARRLMEVTRHLAERLVEEGFELVVYPELPLVAVRVRDRERLLAELWKRRLFVSPSSVPDVVRIVVEPHVTKEHVERLVRSLRELGAQN